MCLNCGCGMPDDNMGNSDNITMETIVKAAKASNMTFKDTVENMKASLAQLDNKQLKNSD